MKIDKRFLLILMAAVLAGACGLAQALDESDDSATGGAVIKNGDSEPPAAPDAATDGKNTPAGETNDPNRVAGNNGGKPGGLFGNPQTFLLVMVGFLVLMYFFSSRSRKKQQTQRQKMLDALNKGDKITTIGGIIGTVVEVKDNEVVVRVDESNNIKMRFVTSAISRVGDASVPDDSKEKK